MTNLKSLQDKQIKKWDEKFEKYWGEAADTIAGHGVRGFLSGAIQDSMEVAGREGWKESERNYENPFYKENKATFFKSEDKEDL